MKRSPEIEAVVRRIWDSGAKGDSATFRNLASRSDHNLSIGLAAHHWWRGFEEAVGVWELHADEIDVARIEIDYLEGFESGSVGWAAGEGAVFQPRERDSRRDSHASWSWKQAPGVGCNGTPLGPYQAKKRGASS